MRLITNSFFFFLLFLTNGQAQAQIRIFGGPQLSSAKYSIRNAPQKTDFKPGFMAGISYASHVEGPLYFVPTLYFSRKGYKVTYDRPASPPDSGARNNDASLHTIAIAPLLHVNLGEGKNHFFVRLGPGIDVGISGKEVFDSAGRATIDRAMRFGPTSYSPATAFATLQFGYETTAGLSLFAHYEHGLSNLNNADRGPMILHRIAGVSLAWRLQKKYGR
jgi:hypothetical protein